MALETTAGPSAPLLSLSEVGRGGPSWPGPRASVPAFCLPLAQPLCGRKSQSHDCLSPSWAGPGYGTGQQEAEDCFCIFFIFEKYECSTLRLGVVFVPMGSWELYEQSSATHTLHTLTCTLDTLPPPPLLHRASSNSLLVTLLDTRFASRHGRAGVQVWNTLLHPDC